MAESWIIQRRYFMLFLAVYAPKGCPDYSGISVRNGPEQVSGLRRNRCPESIGMSVRIGPEYAARLVCMTAIPVAATRGEPEDV